MFRRCRTAGRWEQGLWVLFVKEKKQMEKNIARGFAGTHAFMHIRMCSAWEVCMMYVFYSHEENVFFIDVSTFYFRSLVQRNAPACA